MGGSAPINTISDKQVIVVNIGTLCQLNFLRELFKWARNSDEANKANQLQDEFLETSKWLTLKQGNQRNKLNNEKFSE